MARQMVAGELPESVLNLGFWTLTGGGSPGAEATAWFRVDGQYLPAVDLVRQLPRGKRPSHAKKAVEARLERRPKPLHHYLLFGTAGDAINAAEWKAAGDYVRRYRPTCGFSLDEAVQAEYVTIVGGLSSISREQEQVLRDAGCQVERIGSESTRDTAKAFKMLVKANRRFKGF
jgi:hypothetical protein